MFPIGLVVLLAQATVCAGDAGAVMRDADRLAAELALAEAAQQYEEAGRRGCDRATIAAIYLNGLLAARAAYPAGGSDESLEPVRRADDLLADAGGPLAEIARVLLMAASAAAQSERGQMETLLAHGTQLESLRIVGGETSLPGVTAHELAGDLWLQVHRFDDAKAAYREAADVVGMSPRIAFGLARTAVGLDDTAGACEAYRTLIGLWQSPREVPEVVQARAFLAQHCGTRGGDQRATPAAGP